MDGNQPEYRPAPQPPPTTPAQPEPFYRQHGLAFAIATGVLALVVLLGGTAVGTVAVTSLVLHAGHSQAFRGGGIPRAPEPQQREGDVIRGTIASVSGRSWRVETVRDGAVTVKLTSSTVFGAPGAPKSAADFSPGDEVAVAGSRNGDTITATHVVAIPHELQRPPSRPGSPQTPGDGG
ncbi:DUF5666 domain-containing protein [Leifsonia sp. NPDC058230]|uniref:DUF5666 domain-containing protein n=1 Tax=Leifsonia sp. NPDC058230 TaxID=3346391 RepID=UPI0036DD49D5